MSIERVNPEAINRLDRFWDGLLGNGDGVVAVEPDDAAMVRRLYAMDDAAGPDAGFVRRLEVELGVMAVAGVDAGGRVDGSRREDGGGRTHRSAPTKGFRRVARVSQWASKPVEVAAAVVLFVAIGVAAFGAWQVAGPSASQSPVVPDLDMVALYVSDAAGQGVMPIDPMTLEDVPASDDPLGGVATPEVAGWPADWLASDDGSTVVRVDYRIDVSTPPSALTVTVLDGRTGAVRTTFVHEGLYRDVYTPPLLSGDGSRLLIPNEYFYTHVAGTWPGFAVYDPADGRLVSTVDLFLGGHSEHDRFFVSTDGTRLVAYSVEWLSGSSEVIGPGTPMPEPNPDDVRETPNLAAYDLSTGDMARMIEPWALAQMGSGMDFGASAMVLSPDGETFAIVEADGNRLVLIDTETVVLEWAIPLRRATAAPTQTPETFPIDLDSLFGDANSAAASFSLDGERLYVYWLGRVTGNAVAEVRVIDLAERRVEQEVVLDRAARNAIAMSLPHVDVLLRTSADGEWLYVFSPALPGGVSTLLPPERWPWVLRRLDAETLAVEAEREFRGERSVLMWVSG